MTAWIMVPCRIVLEGLAITSACVTVEGSAPFSTKSVTSPKVRSVRAVSFAPEAPPNAMVGEVMLVVGLLEAAAEAEETVE